MIAKILCRKPKKTKQISIVFITLCYEGGKREDFENLWERAKASGQEDQIFEARDGHGDSPL